MLDDDLRINEFLVGYGKVLVGDLDDSRLAEQPVAGVNHPAWVLGHLTITTFRGRELLGQSVAVPAGWKELYAGGSQPSTDRARYASKDELLAAFESGFAGLRDAVRQATPERLAQPNEHPRLKGALPTVAGMIGFLLTGHVGIHLGQLTTWRRLIGLPPLF